MSDRKPKIEIELSEGDSPGGAPKVRCEIDSVPAVVELGDLSVLGAFVQCNAPLPVDREVRVALRFQDATFAMHAHVVQSVSPQRAASENRKPGFALLFEHIDEQERARLRKRVDAALALRVTSTRPSPVSTPKPSMAPRISPTPQPASAVPTHDDPEELALLQKLTAELAALAGKPAWTILGISQGADPAASKQAFFAASKRYHPHRFSRYRLPALKTIVTELFIAHKRAYDTMLRKTAARPTPLQISIRPPAAFEPASTPPSGPPASTLLRTPLPAMPSPVPVRLSPLPAATPAERAAARASADLSALQGGALRAPQEPKFRTQDAATFVHDALKHLAQGRFDDAEAHLEKALALDPVSQNARVWLLVAQARKLKAGNKLEDALARYREVLALDPKHHEALAETKKVVRAAGPGILSRFFGGNSEEK